MINYIKGNILIFLDKLANFVYRFRSKEPFDLENSKYSNNWFNYSEFYDYIAENKNFTRLVEIGVWKGHSISYLAKKLKNRKNVEIYAVDLFDQVALYNGTRFEEEAKHMYEIYNENLKNDGTRGMVKDLRGDSSKAATRFKDRYFDFVFIDADHSYQAVKRDIESWLPKTRKGGIIAGHDYNQPAAGVKKAVNELFNKDDIREATGGIWYVILD